MIASDVQTATEQERPSYRYSFLALASLVLGVLSLGLLALAGLPALFCGYRALYRINASEGRLHGRPLAITGMILGALTSAFTIFFFIMLASMELNARSNRAACSNNLRLVGTALLAYRDNNQNDFPAATRRGASLPVDLRLSWMTSILPYLERRPDHPSPWQNSARDFDPEQNWNAGPNAPLTRPFLARYVCPAWENLPRQAPAGLTSYIGLAGVGLDAPTLPLTDYNVGFFGYDRATTTADLLLKGGNPEDGGNAPSGSSYIMVVIETCQANGPWGQGGPATCRGLPVQVPRPIGPDAPFGGLHAGGANALWADGAVHFENEGIDPNVLRALVRLRQRQDSP